MKLSISEVVTIKQLLPQKGSFAMLATVDNLEKKLILTDEDKKVNYWKETVVNISGQPDVRYSWENKEAKEVAIVRVERELIIAELEKLDRNKSATIKERTLYYRMKEISAKIDKEG